MGRALAAVCLPFACAALPIGCGGDAWGGAGGEWKAINRPPAVAKGSLAWSPPDAEVAPHAPYTYSVKAADPDVGDAIVGYEWLFGFAETGRFTGYETAAASVAHAFDASPLGNEDGVSAFTVMVRCMDNGGAVGQYEAFSVPAAPPGGRCPHPHFPTEAK
jgi:hypothetical protein